MALAPILEAFTWGSGGQKLTPEQIAREREIAALLGQVDTSPVGDWTQGAARMANAFVGNLREGRANRAEQDNAGYNSELVQSLLGGMGGAATGGYAGGNPVAAALTGGGSYLGGVPVAPLDPASARVAQAHGDYNSALPASFLAAVDRTEGAGGYDTLYGHAQRSGPFAGIDVSSMPISEVLAFSAPTGSYGQHVRGQIGRVATPMGRHQIVGSTLKRAVQELGIDPSTPFNAQTQDMIAAHLARSRLRGAGSMPAKISALRSEWHGFNSVPDSQMVQIINDLESAPTNAAAATEAMASGQMASQQAALESLPVGESMPMPNVASSLMQPQQMQQELVQTAQAGGINPAIIQALSDPRASAGTQQIAQLLLGQQMQAQDPMRQLQMERAQLEIEQLRNPQPQQTAEMQNLAWRAQQAGLQPGSPEYQQFIMTGGRNDGVTVNVGDGSPGLGKLSADYGYVLDPQTREPVIDPATGLPTAAPVPGSPAARQIAAEEDAASSARRNAADYARTVNQDVGIADDYLSSIMDSPFGGDGVIGANLRERRAGIAGTPEYNMKQFVDSALSNVTLDTMNRMRETSAAGATGMGNMSDRQVSIIQGILGNWQPGLPVEDQRYILHRLGNFYMDVQYGTPAERAEAVRDGRMTAEESAAIQELYYPETRDARGRRIDTNKPISEMTDEELEALANGNS